jgi:sugar/nucleoside kinase (ribokinase family)
LSSRRIFGFGTAAIDFRLFTADMGRDYSDKLLSQRTEVHGGGSSANCLVQIARLGGRAAWLGKLGYDWIGERILEQLQGEGVDCSGVIRDPGYCSPFNVVVFAGEGRRRVGGFLVPNILGELSRGDIDRLASRIEAGEWVTVEIGEIPLDLTLAFCLAVKKRGAVLLIDIDLDPVAQCGGSIETVRKICECADILVPNRSALSSLFSGFPPSVLVQRIADSFRTVAVITCGEEGAYFCKPGARAMHQEAFATEVVDTVGAGDAFHGGLLFALARRWSLEEAVRLGARCGAFNCRGFGGRAGMPRAADLDLG